jgi:hypothetical protein
VVAVLAPLLGGAPAVAAGPPSVVGITRPAGVSALVRAGATLRYVVTFDGPVIGVDAGDFTLASVGTATGSVSFVSGSGTTYQVTVGGVSGDGVLRLDLKATGTGITGDGGDVIQGGFTAGQSYTVDSTAPSAPQITSPATTTDSRPTITGTSEVGATITLTVGGATYTTRADGGGGAWVVDLAAASPTSGTLALDVAGPNPVQVTATDAAGNVSGIADQTLVIGSPHPGVTSVSVPADGVYGTGDALDFSVHTQEPVHVDTAGGLPSLELVVGGTVARAHYVGGSGSSTLAFRVTVQPGWQDANGITVGALHLDGGTVRTAAGVDLVTTLHGVGSTAGVLVDGVAPAAPVGELVRDTGASATDGVTSDGRLRVGGLEPGGSWEWSVDGGATWSAGTQDQLLLPEGSFPAGAVRIRQIDAAGNTGPDWVSGRALLIDLSAPTGPALDAIPVRADAGQDAAVGVLVSTDASGPVELVLVAGAGDTDNARFAVRRDRLVLLDPAAAGAGPRTVRVAAVDLAGNRSEAALVVTVHPAEAIPVVVTVQPSDRLEVVPGATATFAVEVAEPGRVATVRWQVASADVRPSPATAWQEVPGAHVLTLAVPVAAGGDAWYRAVVTATDGAVTVSESARLSVWDVRVHAGADHATLAARFPDAADLAGAAPGLDLARLPATVTLSLPWTARDSAVTAFVYSDPTYLGTFAAAAGRVTLTGVALDAGEHYVVLVGVDSGEVRVLHYDTAQAAPDPTGGTGPVAAPTAGTGPVGTASGGTGTDVVGPSATTRVAGADRLARTGADPAVAATGAALLLLAGGALLLGTAARRRGDARGPSRG